MAQGWGGRGDGHGAIVRDATIADMQIPYELILGWRYTRAGRATRRNGFISFISGVSMLGIALGVAALIIVLSVMNGFQKEVRDRMLGVISHIEVFAPNGAARSPTWPWDLRKQCSPNSSAAALAWCWAASWHAPWALGRAIR